MELTEDELRLRAVLLADAMFHRGPFRNVNVEECFAALRRVAIDVREACRQLATETLAVRTDVRVSVTVAVDDAIRALPPHTEATDGKAE